MPLLLLGFAAWFAAAFAWGVWQGFPWLQYQRSEIWEMAVTLLLVPACAAWATTELANLVRPRRAFDRRLRTRASRLGVGLATGLMALIAVSLMLPLADPYVSDAVITGATSAITVAAVVPLLLRRKVPGHCIACGYDQRGMPAPGQPGAGICPECGTQALPHVDGLPA